MGTVGLACPSASMSPNRLYQRSWLKIGKSRYTLRRTGGEETVTDPMTGEPVLDPATGRPEVVETLARIRPRPLVTFRHDPHTSLVRALERFDEESQTSSPVSLLTRRVVVPRPVKRVAETPWRRWRCRGTSRSTRCWTGCATG